MPKLKAWVSTSWAQRPLTTGIVRRQFLLLRGTTWRNNGRSTWNVSRFEHICAFYVEITNIHRGDWKCHVIIVIKTDLSGFVVTMHPGLCEQYVKSLGLKPPRFDFLFRPRPCALWQQTPPELVLIPKYIWRYVPHYILWNLYQYSDMFLNTYGDMYLNIYYDMFLIMYGDMYLNIYGDSSI